VQPCKHGIRPAVDCSICLLPIAAAPAAAVEPKRCPYCDDTGDVHGFHGEWRGRCTCPAGSAAAVEPKPDSAATLPSDGDYMRWAEQAGATIRHEAEMPRITFDRLKHWHAFCDKARAAVEPKP
jgi:hypothetical protein